jgi:nuclear RNA export factor
MAVSSSSRRQSAQRSLPTSRGGKAHFNPLSRARNDARDVSMRDPKPLPQRPSGANVTLRVTGHTRSKAASNTDGGLSSVVKFLERRATIAQDKHNSSKGVSKRHPVRISRSRIEGDHIIINVATEDVKSVLSANGYEFAGANLKIELLAPTGPRSQERFSFGSGRRSPEPSVSPSELSAKFKEIIGRRYDASQKLLDLSAICEDPDLKTMGLTSLTSRSKFFPALMKICEDVFPVKDNGVLSVLLSNNNLTDLAPVAVLAYTFPRIQNLSLDNNKLSSMKSIDRWSNRFRELEHIILTNNPIEQEVPDLKAQLLRWYPKLHSMDGAPLPAAELEAARAKKTPPKPQPGRFDDPDGVGQKFLTMFFQGYDSDRTGLANYYYDDTSRFSMTVNSRAMHNGSQKMEKGEWEKYLRFSRNLKKINHLGPRMKRSYPGPKDVAGVWSQLPNSRHPDFSEVQKWNLECKPEANLPDPTGQIPGGVNGLLITVHGEFEEVESKKIRSFDRIFTLGPGGPNGVRVINDMLNVRAYGGTAAYEFGPTQSVAEPLGEPVMDETAQKEMMVFEVMKRTGMNVQYSAMCLEEVGFDFEKALVAFEQHKANIPAEAFVQ